MDGKFVYGQCKKKKNGQTNAYYDEDPVFDHSSSMSVSEWREEPRGGPPLRRDDRDRSGGWHRDEPSHERDQESDMPPRDRESGGGWRRGGGDDFRDDRARDDRSRDAPPG